MSDPWVTDDDLAEVAEGRAASHEEAAEESLEPVDRVEDIDAGGVPARLYTPPDAVGTLYFLHGGGFVFGDLTTHDGIGRRLANRTGWAVLLADYRRAPEHPWPAADQDAARAGDWLAAHAEGPLVVLGDSAGATLALGETLRQPQRYDAQVLVYPFLDPTCGSYDRELEGVELDLAACEWFWRLYLQGADPAGDRALTVLDGLGSARPPRTLLQLAELDVLTTAGRLLAGRLEAAGVPVRTTVHPGVQHGFWRRTDNDRAATALMEIAGFLDALPSR